MRVRRARGMSGGGVSCTPGERHNWMPSQIRYAPPAHFSTVNAGPQAFSSALMPSIDKAIKAMKPTAPPAMVHRALRCPCNAPWVSASNVLGPGVIDRPMTATR
ncbi:hypothetical protein D3C78_1698280 [compost metagenome]